MRSSSVGSILNVLMGVTKSSQFALSRGMAELTRGTGLTAYAVMPGPTRSEGIVGFLQDLATPGASPNQAERKFFGKRRGSPLLQRLIESKEVPSLVTYLASSPAAASNGAALSVEGGLLRSIARGKIRGIRA